MEQIIKAVASLLSTNPFYAHFFLNSTVKYDNKKVPTAGASLNKNGEPVFYFNTDYVKSLNGDELPALIEHEVLHILFNHTAHFSENHQDLDNMNTAMDCAINQYIKNLPQGGVTPESLKQDLNLTDIELLREWTYYYDLLKNNTGSTVERGKNADSHLGNEEGAPKPSAVSKVTLRDIMARSSQAARGEVPEVVSRILGEMASEDAKLPWKQLLSNFVARSIATTRKPTRKRLNRRFGIDIPGYTKKRELTLGVCVDSSGSIRDEAYVAFMTEIARLSKMAQKTYLIDADCEVQNIQTIKKDGKFNRTRHGNGGTAYQPAIDKCRELKCDAIIYFGDFDCADSPNNPRVPFLWVGIGDRTPPGDFGNVVYL